MPIINQDTYHELASFEDIKRIIENKANTDEETLVVLDLDDTVLTYGQYLGTDKWFSEEVKMRMAQGHSLDEAKNYVLTHLPTIAEHSIHDVRPVEPQIPDIIRELQNSSNINCIVLTSRGTPLRKATFGQLSSTAINLNFNQGLFENQSFKFQQVKNAVFHKGVAFTNGAHKGEALLELLQILNYSPKNIIFVDDKTYNVTNIENSLNTLNVPISYYGFRYGQMDAFNHLYDPNLADIQFERLFNPKILTNEQALALWKLIQRQNKPKCNLLIIHEGEHCAIRAQSFEIYNKLKDILCDASKIEPEFYSLNGGKPKLCYGFEINKSNLNPVCKKLNQAGIVYREEEEPLNSPKKLTM